MKNLKVLVLVLVVASAGCFGKGEGPQSSGNSSDSTSGTGVASPTPTDTRPPIIDPELLNRTLIQKDCFGHVGSLFAPADRVRGKVPEAFALDGPTGLASMLVTVLRCREAVANGSVVGDLWYFESSAFVTPRNVSWQGGNANRFLIDVRVSDEAVSEWLGLLGLEVSVAEFEETNTSEMGRTIYEWSVTDPGGGFVVSSVNLADPAGSSTLDIRLWHGISVLQRALTNVQVQPDSGQVVFPLECTGASDTCDIYGQEWPSREGTVLHYNSTLEFSTEVFEQVT